MCSSPIMISSYCLPTRSGVGHNESSFGRFSVFNDTLQLIQNTLIDTCLKVDKRFLNSSGTTKLSYSGYFINSNMLWRCSASEKRPKPELIVKDSRAVFGSRSASFSCLAVGHVDTRNEIWLVCVAFLSFSTSNLHSCDVFEAVGRPTDIGVSTGTAAVFDFSGYFSDTFSVILWCFKYPWNN
jgi:hypothetical protein